MAVNNSIIKITLKPLDLSFFLKILNNKILIANHGTSAPDLEIILTPSSLLKAKIYGFEHCIKNKDIKISGDMMVALKLREIMASYHFDLETKLANIFGDFFAAQFTNTATRFTSLAQEVARAFAQDCKEFVEDELQIVVTREEVNKFVTDVDELRFALDRIEAKYAYRSASN